MQLELQLILIQLSGGIFWCCAALYRIRARQRHAARVRTSFLPLRIRGALGFAAIALADFEILVRFHHGDSLVGLRLLFRCDILRRGLRIGICQLSRDKVFHLGSLKFMVLDVLYHIIWLQALPCTVFRVKVQLLLLGIPLPRLRVGALRSSYRCLLVLDLYGLQWLQAYDF